MKWYCSYSSPYCREIIGYDKNESAFARIDPPDFRDFPLSGPSTDITPVKPASALLRCKAVQFRLLARRIQPVIPSGQAFRPGEKPRRVSAQESYIRGTVPLHRPRALLSPIPAVSSTAQMLSQIPEPSFASPAAHKQSSFIRYINFRCTSKRSNPPRRPRRTPRACAPGAGNDDPESGKRDVPPEVIEEFRMRQSEEPPLGPAPHEESGFYGWRSEDDEYWRRFRERVASFKTPMSMTEADLRKPEQPLDRHGKPVEYPAAAMYDDKLQDWRPTTEEEEHILRTPQEEYDPYFVPVAEDKEHATSMAHPRDYMDWERGNVETEDYTLSQVNLDADAFRKSVKRHRRRPLGIDPGDWKVVHLGTSSAIPTRKRNVSGTAVVTTSLSSQRASKNGIDAMEGNGPDMFIVDAGENSDAQLRSCAWCMTHGFRWIRAIFITHLHGDHIYGLPKLLSSIALYAQFRRRKALENGDDSDPVIRIFGPYGTRGFLRSSLYWTNPLGVRFSVSELVPRDSDFGHVRKYERGEGGRIYVEDEDGNIEESQLQRTVVAPHVDEVRTDDIEVGEDGVWHLWNEGGVEIVAAPLKHRLVCFGYVFREVDNKLEDVKMNEGNGAVSSTRKKVNKNVVTVDMDKARALGVYGSQFGVLRSGRSIVSSRTGAVVKPEDVTVAHIGEEVQEVQMMAKPRRKHKVTVLGDTCDSSMIANAAQGSDLMIHEATFSDVLRQKARVSMHSTARMAGTFAKSIETRKLALTHFSSRYEAVMGGWEGVDGDDEVEGDLANANELVKQAAEGCGGRGEVVAAVDFMEHDIREGKVRTFVPRWRRAKGKKEDESETGVVEEVEVADEVGGGLTGARGVVEEEKCEEAVRREANAL